MLPRRQLQYRLGEMMDMALDVLRDDPEFRHYHLDGQSLVLEEYCRIRPQRRAELAARIAEGRLLAGPWYSIVHQPVLEGESLVRNLLAGKKVCQEFGRRMDVGFTPGSFGHVGQLPQIFCGFGIDNAMISRGITRDQVQREFWWQSPDGSKVLGIHLPDDFSRFPLYYKLRKIRPAITSRLDPKMAFKAAPGELPMHLCSQDDWWDYHWLYNQDIRYDAEAAVAEINELERDLKADMVTDVQFLGYGFDFSFPEYKMPALIRSVNEKKGYEHLVHSSLPAYLREVKRELKTRPAKTFVGEMRHANRDSLLNFLYSDVNSSRIPLKIQNSRCENLLIRWAEPFALFARQAGLTYPQAYLEMAWKKLLLNHSHDSICGCATDRVHGQMVGRFEEVEDAANAVIRASLGAIAAKADSGGADYSVVVFNPLATARTEAVTAFLDFPSDAEVRYFTLLDAGGGAVPCQVTSKVDHIATVFSREEFPRRLILDRYGVTFLARDVPAMGYTAFAVTTETGKKQRFWYLDVERPARGPVSESGMTIENEFLRVGANGNGSYSLADKTTGYAAGNLGIFAESGDVGDGWRSIPPMNDRTYTTGSAVAAVSVEGGPVRSTLRIEMDMLVPSASAATGRSPQLAPLHIVTELSLAAGARWLEVKTSVNNTAKDHKLRVLLPTGIKAASSFAHAPYDVQERSVAVPDSSKWREPQPTAHPQLSFVDVTDGERGFAVLNRGLPEFEVLDEGTATVALTLIRAVGKSIGDDPSQDGGQCLGQTTFHYALYPHEGDWEKGNVPAEAQAFRCPPKAIFSYGHTGALPPSASFLEIKGEGVSVEAVKKAEANNNMIVRLLNPTGAPKTCRVSVNTGIASAQEVRLDEKRIGKLPIAADGTLKVTISPKKILTLELAVRK